MFCGQGTESGQQSYRMQKIITVCIIHVTISFSLSPSKGNNSDQTHLQSAPWFEAVARQKKLVLYDKGLCDKMSKIERFVDRFFPGTITLPDVPTRQV